MSAADIVRRSAALAAGMLEASADMPSSAVASERRVNFKEIPRNAIKLSSPTDVRGRPAVRGKKDSKKRLRARTERSLTKIAHSDRPHFIESAFPQSEGSRIFSVSIADGLRAAG